MDIGKLIEMALAVRQNAYVPYSGFRVGAALLTGKGKVYTGCNVENASYGATCCAERTAVFKAVSEGGVEFKAIAVASDSEELTFPCGICRQVLAEFKIPRIIAANKRGEYREFDLKELLPYAFAKDALSSKKFE